MTFGDWDTTREPETCDPGQECRTLTCTDGAKNDGQCDCTGHTGNTCWSCAGLGLRQCKPIAATDPDADECQPCEERTTAYGRWQVTREATTCEAGERYQPLNCRDGVEGMGGCPWSCNCASGSRCDIGGRTKEIPATNPSACICPTGASGTPPDCDCPDDKEYDPATNSCRAPPPTCPADATGTHPDCTCTGAGEVYDRATNSCGPPAAACPSDATGTHPDCTCTDAGEVYDSTDNTCEAPAPRSCGTDEIGTPPNCTPCGAGEVLNDAGTACEACPTGQTEATAGRCDTGGTAGGRGHCTRRGLYYPGDETGCVAGGFVLTNGQCPRYRCPDNSTDNGAGVCDCDPGYVYTVPVGAFYGPANCTARTAALCGAVADPGTCGAGGTWNSGAATCDCGEGYERSGDGQSCVAVRRYRAGICPRNLDGIPARFGPVRHDDMQSYSELAGSRSNERASGFYATSMPAAITAALAALASPPVIVYVDGEHRHTLTTDGSDCVLPIVDKATFDTIRASANNIVWTEYHLLTRNCQRWACAVVPEECDDST